MKIAILIISAITCVLILSILVHLLTDRKEYDISDVYKAASGAREKCIKDAQVWLRSWIEVDGMYEGVEDGEIMIQTIIDDMTEYLQNPDRETESETES